MSYVLNLQSQIIEWAKQQRLLIDSEGSAAYLLDSATDDCSECKRLPFHVKNLIENYIVSRVFHNPHDWIDEQVFYCDGPLESDTILTSIPCDATWVNAQKVSLWPTLSHRYRQ